MTFHIDIFVRFSCNRKRIFPKLTGSGAGNAPVMIIYKIKITQYELRKEFVLDFKKCGVENPYTSLSSIIYHFAGREIRPIRRTRGFNA